MLYQNIEAHQERIRKYYKQQKTGMKDFVICLLFVLALVTLYLIMFKY